MKKRFALVSIVAVSVVGCGQESPDGSESKTDVGALAERLTVKLPQPTTRYVEDPPLSEDEARRSAEVEQELLRRYAGYRIVETTQTYLGTVIDWVDPATVPGSELEPPESSPSPAVEIADEVVGARKPPETVRSMNELEQYPELAGPRGTIPIVRPTFGRYVYGKTTARSLDDFLKNYQYPGQPTGQKNTYTGYIYSGSTNTAVVGNYAVYKSGNLEDDTFSLVEMSSWCPGTDAPNTLEMVGIVITRDRLNFSDQTCSGCSSNPWPIVQVEFMTGGVNNLGNNAGGWDGQVTGFVPAAGRAWGPGLALTTVSTVGGTQYDRRFEIQRDSSGNWWLKDMSTWLGYYPASFFNVITSSACKANWYSEVRDNSETDWTNDDVGSGHYAADGFGNSAYIRDNYYRQASDGNTYWLPTSTSGGAGPFDLDCYDWGALFNGSTGWNSSFYFGGIGGDNAGCP